ncbi:hypothetical protein ACLBV5_04455, partial [Brevundimonas sp. M1A4_2e]
TAAQAALLPTQPISTQINLGLLLWLDEKRGSRHLEELLNLTRRQILTRQIDSAIWLLRVRKEPVVANLVAHAAIDVLRSLARESGAKTFKGSMEAFIKPDRLKEWRDLDRAAYNHSKHADKDPNAELKDYNPSLASFNVLAAVIDFGEVFKKVTPSMLIFRTFEMAEYPELIQDGDFKDLHDKFLDMARSSFGSKPLREVCGDMLQYVESNPLSIAGWPMEHLELTE